MSLKNSINKLLDPLPTENKQNTSIYKFQQGKKYSKGTLQDNCDEKKTMSKKRR